MVKPINPNLSAGDVARFYPRRRGKQSAAPSVPFVRAFFIGLAKIGAGLLAIMAGWQLLHALGWALVAQVQRFRGGDLPVPLTPWIMAADASPWPIQFFLVMAGCLVLVGAVALVAVVGLIARLGGWLGWASWLEVLCGEPAANDRELS